MEIAHYKQRFYRNDIQGIRAVSAFLIIIHHIWTNKVSGGVDVFFVISGFLMGSILLREYAYSGKINIFAFYAKIFKRILPTAFFVLCLTALFTLVFIPVPLWKFGINEFIASVLQVENWELFRTSVNYLDRDNPQSQFQQYWALSMQSQFYLVLPVVFLIFSLLKKNINSIYVLFLCCSIIFLGSLYYSISNTDVSPEQSYFNTFMRLWEFFLGVLVAIAYPYFNPDKAPKKLINFTTTALVLVFITFGFWVPDTLNFPGWIALVPAFSIAIFILLGKKPDTKGAVKFLEHKYISNIGKFSFTLYLCHWPILIFYQHYLERTKLTLLEGVSVITLALSISFILYYLFENPLQKKLKSMRVLPSIAFCTVLVIALASGGLYVRFHLMNIAQLRVSNESPTPEVLDGTHFDAVDFNYWLTVDYDRPSGVKSCLGKVCYLGDQRSDKVVVLLGVSHAAHYQPFFESMAQRYGFQLVTVLTHPESFNVIKEINPDLLISSGTVTVEPGTLKQERIAEEYSETWSFLSNSGVPILLIRDTPRFNFYQNACLWKKNTNNLNADKDCTVKRSDIYSGPNPLESLKGQGVYAVDFSNLLCDEYNCFSEINGVPVYYDKHHFTNRFILSNSGKLLDEIKIQAPDFYKVLTN